jgi:hypothetical protein
MSQDETPEVIEGEPGLTRAAARINEAYRRELPHGCAALLRPPSKRDMELLRQAILANGGKWKPIRDEVQMATRWKVDRDDPPGSVLYGLGSWNRKQEQKRKEAERRAARLAHEIKPSYYSGDKLAEVKSWTEPTEADREAAQKALAEIRKKLAGDA